MNRRFLEKINPQNTLLRQLTQVKKDLVSGILDNQLENGWADIHYNESVSSKWTTIVVLRSLLRHRVNPENLSSAVNKVLKEKQECGDVTGWDIDGRFPYISSYVTADALLLLLELKKFDDARQIITSLLNMRNKDGGWGVCQGDLESKVPNTAWVLNALLDAYEYMPNRNVIDQKLILESISWLYKAQNDEQEDNGWGYLPNSIPSTVGSTCEALGVLLKAANLNTDWIMKKERLRKAVQTLREMGNAGYWKGEIENYQIKIGNDAILRHITGGLGTLSVIITFIRGVYVGIVSPDDQDLFNGINNLMERCKPIPSKKGCWIYPSDQGGPPIVWNSAYALDAIAEIDKFFIDVLEGSYIDRKVYATINSKTKVWRIIAIALSFAVISITFSTYFQGLMPLIDKFSKLSPLSQGIILIVLTIVIEEIYHLSMPMLKKFTSVVAKRLRKNK